MTSGRVVVAQISGHARMAPSLRRRLGLLRDERPTMAEALRDALAIEKLTDVIDAAVARARSASGRVDMTDVAAHVLAEVRPTTALVSHVLRAEDVKAAGLLSAVAEDAAAHAVLAGLLTEAWERSAARGTGVVVTRDVAAYVLGAMRRGKV